MTEPRDRAAVCGVVLAAGASTRAGGPKALARLDGETLVARAVRSLRAACANVVLVIAPPHGEAIAAAAPEGVQVSRNPEPGRGMCSSLQIGLAAAVELGAEAAVVHLIDHPRVRVGTVKSLVEAWAADDAVIVHPSHDGRRGHPYVLDRAVFDAVRALDPTTSARPVLHAARPALELEVDDPHISEDLDTLEELLSAGLSVDE